MENRHPASRPLPVVALAAGVGGAIVGAGLWMGIHLAVQQPWVPAILSLLAGPLAGLFIGLAMRVGPSHPTLKPVALGLTILAGVAGYLLTDLFLITWVNPAGQVVQPTVSDALRRFTGDITAWLLIALGGYLAWISAPRR